MKYKVGDRVKNSERGKGTVIGIPQFVNNQVLVEYDKKFLLGHTGEVTLLKNGRHGKNGHCWFEYRDDLTKINDKKHFKSLPNDYTGKIEVENGYLKEILDEKEKEYLLGIIKPFKEKVDCIVKIRTLTGLYYIKIVIKNEIPILLPYFKTNSMYKGMESNIEYSLKELGL